LTLTVSPLVCEYGPLPVAPQCAAISPPVRKEKFVWIHRHPHHPRHPALIPRRDRLADAARGARNDEMPCYHLSTMKRVLLVLALGLLLAAAFRREAFSQSNLTYQIAPGVYFRDAEFEKRIIANTGWVVFRDYVMVMDANFPWGARAVLEDLRKTSFLFRKCLVARRDHHHENFRERLGFAKFRAEAFNLTNTYWFYSQQLNNNTESATFGTLDKAAVSTSNSSAPRQVQFAVKFIW